jgi:stage III sporulation protein SpoIIIAA
MTQRRITDDLHALLGVLPTQIADAVVQANNSDALLEIVLDLGRLPMARFTTEEVTLAEREVSREDIDYVVARIGNFDADNRAGLERTLHRISAIRNRRGHIVGLTCRVGRAVYGTIDIIQDLITSGKSVLILGKPGIGKTTMLREAARILAEKNRVIIVDTSNEIGGDGDVPHPAVGGARRMQVASPSLQHEVMIEAVENHNPEVIVIDEIGRELEALAARTIAERGVQLIGTAHGRTLENLLLNPTLSDLVGGIESVTLSDEEARRRGTQKTVLERRAPPTFDVLIEIQERDRLSVHPDVAAAVDTLVRGYPPQPEIRFRDENDEIRIEKPAPITGQHSLAQGLRRTMNGNLESVNPYGDRPARTNNRLMGNNTHQIAPPNRGGMRRQETVPMAEEHLGLVAERRPSDVPDSAILTPIRIFPYGVAKSRLIAAAKRLGVPAVVVGELDEANSLVTLRTYYRNHEATIMDAEQRGLPIYALRANTINQMEQVLAEIFNLSSEAPDTGLWEEVTNATQMSIDAVLNGQRWADLPPASAAIRRIQHDMARQAQLVSHSYGKEPNRRVRIFRE